MKAPFALIRLALVTTAVRAFDRIFKNTPPEQALSTMNLALASATAGMPTAFWEAIEADVHPAPCGGPDCTCGEDKAKLRELLLHYRRQHARAAEKERAGETADHKKAQEETMRRRPGGAPFEEMLASMGMASPFPPGFFFGFPGGPSDR